MIAWAHLTLYLCYAAVSVIVNILQKSALGFGRNKEILTFFFKTRLSSFNCFHCIRGKFLRKPEKFQLSCSIHE